MENNDFDIAAQSKKLVESYKYLGEEAEDSRRLWMESYSG